MFILEYLWRVVWQSGMFLVLVSGFLKFFTFALRQMGGILSISFLTVLFFSLFIPARKK